MKKRIVAVIVMLWNLLLLPAALGGEIRVFAAAYAMEALKNAGVAAGVEGKLVMARDVREAMAYAERGEVDGAFVYRTDVLPGRGASIFFVVPRFLYSRVTYLMGPTAEGAGNPEAAAFYRFLGSAEAKRFLESRGFDTR